MPEQPIAYNVTKGGMQITVQDVPAVFTEAGEEIGLSLAVLRRVDELMQEAQQQANPGTTVLNLAYTPGPGTKTAAPDPVSLELRRALRERRMSGATLAAQLQISPPVVSRWLSPSYHTHGVDTLRRIADVLDMDVEVHLVPRAR